MFEEAGSFQKCTYTRAASNTSHPPHIPVVISFKKHTLSLLLSPPVVCADAKKVSSDNMRTLSALNNLRYICCHPDVKQKKKKTLEMMPKCKSCKFPSAGVFQGVIDYSSASWMGRVRVGRINRKDFTFFLLRIKHCFQYCLQHSSPVLAPTPQCSVICLHRHCFQIFFGKSEVLCQCRDGTYKNSVYAETLCVRGCSVFLFRLFFP